MRDDLLLEFDECMSEGRIEEAEKLLNSGIDLAVSENDDAGLLTILNELMDYYVRTGNPQRACQVASAAISLAERMELMPSIPGATTLLNAANAYRAAGELDWAMECYKKVRAIYDALLPKESLMEASLDNNISLLNQEMGNYRDAENELIKALKILTKLNERYEMAVVFAALANNSVELKEFDKAEEYADKSERLFEELNIVDDHYAAVLYVHAIILKNKGDYEKAHSFLSKGMNCVQDTLKETDSYNTMKEVLKELESRINDNKKDLTKLKGIELSRYFYFEYVKPMIHDKFPKYEDRIAAGLVGNGSDCFGFDDELSKDHDWGPGVCLWLSKKDKARIGKRMEAEYRKLPNEIEGVTRSKEVNPKIKRGVNSIEDFYSSLLNTNKYEDIDWANVEDRALASASNGEVFEDFSGKFSELREKLKKGYPKSVLLTKIAEAASDFSRCAQYNYFRVSKRGDKITKNMMLSDGLKAAMKLMHYVENVYPPHDKWLFKSLDGLKNGADYVRLMRDAVDGNSDAIEQIGSYMAQKLYSLNYVSSRNSYLDDYKDELLFKAGLADLSKDELADRLNNLDCNFATDNKAVQTDKAFETLEVMKLNRYRTWNEEMITQYIYDYNCEKVKGRDIISEKYLRMLESTDQDEYRKIEDTLPKVSEEKKKIIDKLVFAEVGCLEELNEKYPELFKHTRSIHSYEDNSMNTSYETYLKGELLTYSDKMLELYNNFWAKALAENENPCLNIVNYAVKEYGHKDLKEAEAYYAAE